MLIHDRAIRTFRKSGQSKLETERDNAVKEVDNLCQLIEWQSRVVNFKIFSLLDVQKPTYDLSNFSMIGERGYGSVYKGTLLTKEVAIKILNIKSLQGETEFNQEVEILAGHPDIVSLTGASREARALIFEFAPNGSLNTLLSKVARSYRLAAWHCPW